MANVRPPAVAGSFYPSDPAELQGMVDTLLEQATTLVTPVIPRDVGGKPLRELVALQVPHAGYIYSGVIAAAGYQLLRGLKPKRVVVAGPTHRVGVRGIALSKAAAFATPLGELPVDQAAQSFLEEHADLVKFFEPSHEEEHSLEVQLPFLQTVLKGVDFKIVPLAVGDCPPDKVSAALQTLRQLPGEDPSDTLIVISSDLSHYLPYDEARQVDAITLTQALSLEYPLDPRQACGSFAWSGMNRLARKVKLQAELLANANSGDTAGDRNRVVGYSAVAYWKYNLPSSQEGIPDEYGSRFPALARRVLEGAFAEPRKEPQRSVTDFTTGDPVLETLLDAPGAAFVTLTKSGELRGCIGSLAAHRKLGEDIAQNAMAAALEDPRFPPVRFEELSELRIEVSVLSEPRPFDRNPGETEADYLGRLRPGVDGVILRKGYHRATFLPQVWEDLPQVRDFIDHLLRKAGLRPTDFDAEVQLETYQVQAWSE